MSRMRTSKKDNINMKKRAERLSAKANNRNRKAHLKANLLGDKALLSVTDDLRFFGDVIIESRDDAIAAAKLSDQGPHKLHLFVDGSTFYGEHDKGSGAAVVYKSSADPKGWVETIFHIPGARIAWQAEEFAIAEALAVAVPWAIRAKDRSELQIEVIHETLSLVIFTDCERALWKLVKHKGVAFPRSQLQGNAVYRKIVTRSQYLGNLGVQVQLRWIPGHTNIMGNERAHQRARYAAKHRKLNMVRDEGLELIEAEVTEAREKEARLAYAGELQAHYDIQQGKEVDSFPQTSTTMKHSHQPVHRQPTRSALSRLSIVRLPPLRGRVSIAARSRCVMMNSRDYDIESISILQSRCNQRTNW